MRLRNVHTSLFTVTTMMLFAIGVHAQQQPDPTGAGGGVTGYGAANTIPVRTGSSSVGNSVMFQTVGNVGIGTATPGAKLDVAGDINFSGVLRFQGSPVLRVFPEGTGNIGLGPSTLQSNITGSTNLAIGEQALQNNTTGLQNTAVCWQALRTSTVGVQGNGQGRPSVDTQRRSA